jgi:hypothetical protein
MNLTFGNAKPVEVSQEDIILDGVVIGEMNIEAKDSGIRRYHAAIKVKRSGYVALGLLQGFGETRDKAIVDAIDRGQKDANAVLDYISDLKKQLNI